MEINNKSFIITISTGVIIGVIVNIISPNINLSYIYKNYLFETLFTLFLLIILTIIIKAIKNKMNNKEERNVLIELITDDPIYIREHLEYPKKKLKWGVRNREFCRWIIDNNPLCPKCGKKLEEKEHHLWYEWICTNPKCNQSTYRTWNHKTILMSKAENLIKNKKS